MGYPITKPSDYIGEVSISLNKYDEKDLMLYIEEYEECILNELLGCELTTELIADLDINNNPTEDRFIEIWDKFCIDDSPNVSFLWDYGYFYEHNDNYGGHGCKVQWKSRGIKELLKYQIFFYYTRDQKHKNTITGNVVNQNNVSRESRNAETNIRRLYNKSINTYNAIQWRICKNENDRDYESFNGINKQKIGIL